MAIFATNGTVEAYFSYMPIANPSEDVGRDRMNYVHG